MKEMQVTVIDQREINFYGDQIIAVKDAGGEVFVPLRPICDALGVNWSAQFRRVKRDEILNRVQGVAIMATPGGEQSMVAIPLKYLNGWLFGISDSRVKDGVRERLLQYKLDCYSVLHDAFQLDQVTARPDSFVDELLQGDSAEARAYQMAMAIANMAREQLLIRKRFESTEAAVAGHEQRLQILEAGQGDASRYISTAEASQLSQAVKAIGLELGKRSGRNEFGGVYGELYRRFEITSYRELPSVKFDEAMNFLRGWHGTIVGGDVPF